MPPARATRYRLSPLRASCAMAVAAAALTAPGASSCRSRATSTSSPPHSRVATRAASSVSHSRASALHAASAVAQSVAPDDGRRNRRTHRSTTSARFAAAARDAAPGRRRRRSDPLPPPRGSLSPPPTWRWRCWRRASSGRPRCTRHARISLASASFARYSSRSPCSSFVIGSRRGCRASHVTSLEIAREHRGVRRGGVGTL
mmetsp:Transcript_4436/g.18006  ORF Transcript_4436/g.18006 Transcript_4436/m.18006 type:complete len:202 (+) Transcript_4436:930-1535(+)